MGSYIVTDSKLQELLNTKKDYESFIAKAPGLIAQIDREIEGLQPLPKRGSIHEICDIMKQNYHNARKRDQLALSQVEIGATLSQYLSLLPDITQAIEFYFSANPGSVQYVKRAHAPPAEERVIDISPPKVDRKDTLLEHRIAIPVPPSTYSSVQGDIEKPSYLRFFEYRNSHSQKRLSTIIREAAIPEITNTSEAYGALRTAMSEGHMVNRYDNDLASDTMRDEMVRAYCTDFSKSLKTIAEELSRKYHLHVSESTIRNYARNQLGDISRRDHSAERRYKRKNYRLGLLRNDSASLPLHFCPDGRSI
jgi:hypothetical protein